MKGDAKGAFGPPASMFLPDKSNEPDYGADGKIRVCVVCGELLSNYTVKKRNNKISRTLKGFICYECGHVVLPLKQLNSVIDLFDE